MYTIETGRLILRKWKLNDIDDLAEGLGDFNVAKNLTVPFPYTKKEAEEFIKLHLDDNENNYYFAVVLKESNKVIGGTSIEIREDSKTIGRGGIWFNKNYLGKGYGTETWCARAKFAFEVLNLTELQNGYFDFNEISWKMQKKIGFKQIGQRKNYSHALQKEVIEILTSLKKEDFIDVNKLKQE